MKVGVLTAGSDTPGLNAAVRAIGKSIGKQPGWSLLGFLDGFQGLVEDRSMDLHADDFSGILTTGGTILGTSRARFQDLPQDSQDFELINQAIKVIRQHQVDILICIGGKETQESAKLLADAGVKIITLPKAIDNDLYGTDYAIGFDTALGITTEAVDRLHNSAHSSHRIIILGVMGRYAGWLTLAGGVAGGADVILIPEIPYDIKVIADAILDRKAKGKRFSIIAVAEGAISVENARFFDNALKVNQMIRSGPDQADVELRITRIRDQGIDGVTLLANQLEHLTGLETRTSILGYLLRGGVPSAQDRFLATKLGTICIEMIKEGVTNVMVGVQGDSFTAVPLSEVSGKHKLVSPNHPWLISARYVGTCLGDQ
ncbi:MAG TPA: ATP-dependent 6-phosphofructokinase [Anaerolineaceae bacterium]